MKFVGDLEKLQAEVSAWRAANFPKGENFDGLMRKLIEEVGELADAGSSRGNVADLRDALGDVVIVLAGIAEIKGVSLGGAIREVWGEVSQRDYVKFPRTGRPGGG